MTINELESEDSINDAAVAIIGMAGRFPKAKDIETFWHNLRDGVESISFFSERELLNAGIAPTYFNYRDYVRAGAVLEDIEMFDAPFFGFSPKEAEITDPQHRVFLECAFTALENAGYNPRTYPGLIGVYAGGGMNSYLLKNIYPNYHLRQTVNSFQIVVGNDKDYLCTRVSYKLHLNGPSINVQTACSTSLVAVHLACQSLLNGECDMALAGGISIHIPQKEGYFYQQDMIFSPDGHCRAFDAKARGTVVGNGVGIVVLKRLPDAIADRDRIYAVIRGSAVNNDGFVKVGYTAPSVDGQAAVISEALALSGVDIETISYIEAHGTGTILGDPIEIAALKKAFRHTQKKGYCAIGSVKTNLGHLENAAGIASLIKTVLAMQHKMIPPSLHFEAPNPEIDFANSPFYVNSTLKEWKTNGTPRRAGVSSFGIGGTNAHVILEEPPAIAENRSPDNQGRGYQLLLLSAKTSSALQQATVNLAAYLQQNPQINLADVAYTLKVGRQAFKHRRMLVCQNLAEAAALLATPNQKVLTNRAQAVQHSIVFMFSGQGSQYVNMARELYQTEPTFRQELDICCQLLKTNCGLDLQSILYPDQENADSAEAQLKQTAITQPALFAIEYALAKLWMAWGVSPQIAIGHSIGEYVAACLAGVFSLSDALSLVAARGRAIGQLPGGSMLAVPLSESECLALIQQFEESGERLSLATINGPSQCVLSGATTAIEKLAAFLAAKQIESRQLHTSHAFHSHMMEPILSAFAARVKQIELKPPQLRYISNVTGTWITPAQATDPNYWVNHLRQTVRFADGLQEIFSQPNSILIEVGPGSTLSTLAKRHPDKPSDQLILSSLRHPKEQQSDVAFLLNALGQLWLAGFPLDWKGFYNRQERYRVPLPSYPFERKPYWIDPPKEKIPQANGAIANGKSVVGQKRDLADWFYVPSWQISPLPTQPSQPLVTSPILVFIDECGLGNELVKQLEQQQLLTIVVKMGSEFTQVGKNSYTLNPGQRQDYDLLFDNLTGKMPKTIVHLWNVNPHQSGLAGLERAKDWGFYSLLFLAQALGKKNFTESVQIAVISEGMHKAIGNEVICPEKAIALGPIKVIPQEYPNISCRSIDIDKGDAQTQRQEDGPTDDILLPTPYGKQLAQQLLVELANYTSEPIAYRNLERWVQTFEPVRLDRPKVRSPRLKLGGVYLITGGIGGIGLVLAEYLAQGVKAKLILTGRSPFPPSAEWEKYSNSAPLASQILKLMELEKLGSEVVVETADVTDIEQMRSVINRTLARFGSIDGVIHAAGVPAGGLIQPKTREMVEKILAPKLKGTLVLDSLLKDIPLDFFVLCSSIVSVQGGFGQVDYCAANSFLDAFARHKNSPNGTLVVSINWNAWQEVGMAVAAAQQLSKPDISQPQFETVPHPLFDRRIVEGPHQEVYITKFSADKHWVLNEHRIVGKATLPGTAYLEMVRAAWEIHAQTTQVEIQNVFFLAPLTVSDSGETEVRTQLKKQGNCWEFKIFSQVADRWQEHCTGSLVHLAETAPKVHQILEIEAQCTRQKLTLDASETKPKLGAIEFGLRWNNLKQVFLGEERGLAVLELPEKFAEDLPLYKMHPALLDTATGFLIRQVESQGTYLPFSYKRVRIKGGLTQKAYSYVSYNQSGQDALKFNVTILDERGTELIEIEEYTWRKINAT
ncbi:MAG TPA: beta-ketoacyl synthase [Cyanobacteria bacterium UBA9273]|nr:beta-ketoacyl synthase [Cyanobacteria bacterium UBA9273]